MLGRHWGVGGTGAGPARLLAPVSVSAACFSLRGRGPGAGRRRVDLNVFGSPVLRPWIGSCRCRGVPLSRVLHVDWYPSRAPPLASSIHEGLGAGRSALPGSRRLAWIAATLRPWRRWPSGGCCYGGLGCGAPRAPLTSSRVPGRREWAGSASFGTAGRSVRVLSTRRWAREWEWF